MGGEELLHPDHRQRVMDKIKHCFATGEVWEDTFPLRGRDGKYRLFLSKAVPIRDSEGKITRWFGTNTDISASEESGAKYRGLLEAAPDAMVVVNVAGEIVLLNVQAEKQFGYSRDELVGQPVKNIIPEGFAERLISDGTRSTAAALAQQIGTGIELVGRRRDGSKFPLEIMLSPLENADGILVTAAIRDISVRKAAEAHLGQMEGRYRGLLEAAPDAMVVVDVGGKIVLLNAQAEKKFGYCRNELIGQKVTNIIPEGFAERLLSDGTRSTAAALAQQIGTGIELRGAAQGRQRVSPGDHAQPARQRGRNSGDGGHPRHHRAQGRGSASGTNGGPVPRAAGSGSRCHGGGETGRRDRPAQRAGGKTIRIPPRRTGGAEGEEHHSRRASRSA